MQTVFVDDPDMIIVDVDFNDTHLVLILREGQTLRLCAVPLPLPDHKVGLASYNLFKYWFNFTMLRG